MVSVLVAHDPREDEWVCQVPFFPPYQSLKVIQHTAVPAGQCYFIISDAVQYK